MNRSVLALLWAEHVEAGEPEGSAEQEQKGENQSPGGAQHAQVDHGGRNDSEGAEVDEGIEFDSETGVLADEAGDASVHRIQGGSEHDQPGCGNVAALDHVLQRQKGAEQVAHGEHVGKQQPVHHSHTPMMVSPARTAVAHLDGNPHSLRQQVVDPGPEADEPEALPQGDLVPFRQVTGDAAGEDADDLLDDEPDRSIADPDHALLVLRRRVRPVSGLELSSNPGYEIDPCPRWVNG